MRFVALRFLLSATATFVTDIGRAQETTRLTVQPAKARQVYDGIGAGVIFYEGHVTSLAARDKSDCQERLYDDLFARVRTNYLQLMIRETHEPRNDNADPYAPAFDVKDFDYCKHTLAVAKAALKRRPDIKLYATLYTPPPWMKTNNAASGGGEARATLKDGLELELGEYVWAFLAHMHRHGATIHYLSIANEPDWPHTQPGYFLTAERHAAVFKAVATYLDVMARKFPDVPRPKLVGPNTLSAVGAARDYVPAVLKAAGKHLDVVGTHDYDPRGDRLGALRKLAGNRPMWVTEWCARTKDPSAGMIAAATEYGAALCDAFNGGANVWMAYDWVYPPRDSGEALVHVDWGNDYALTKPYQVVRQWAAPLTPGMRVVEATAVGRAASGVKTAAFLSAGGKTLVVHVVNVNDKGASIALKLTGGFTSATTAGRTRTSGGEDAIVLSAAKATGGSFADVLPARSMTTYVVEADGK